MRKTVLFIGMSLDGYIADINGKVEWMNTQEVNAEEFDSYSSFIKNVDTIIMGYNTYHQIVSELSIDSWVYEGMTSYVITHKKMFSKEDIIFTDEDPCNLVKRLKIKDGKWIWVCGGADIVNQLMKEDLIDRYHISVLPILLGNGMRLFKEDTFKKSLKLIDVCSYNGIVDIVYER